MNETCTHCGAVHPSGELTPFQDGQFCPSCLSEHTILCDHCHTRIWVNDDIGEGDTALCRSCHDNHYTYCTTCDALISNSNACYEEDSDEPYCYSCYEGSSEHCAIHSYNHKPEPVFYGEGNRFYGVELEIDGGGERSDYARILLDVANADKPYLYIKHDGSLDCGLELVTHPLSFEVHQKEMPWQAVLEKAHSLHYLSHQARTCGLHIHVNRSSFGSDQEEQEAAIARILYFVENHWLELLRFSRRTENQMNQWAARYGRKDSPKEVLDTAKNRYGRYTCVNLTNYDTIEFRMFRGTLKYNTLIATLQLVNEICRVAVSLSDAELDGLSWSGFVEQLDTDSLPELVQYLRERRLFVNEPVASGEEV